MVINVYFYEPPFLWTFINVNFLKFINVYKNYL